MQKIFDLCKRTAESTWFQATIIAAIVAAGVVVGIQTYEATSQKVRGIMGLLDALDLFILIVFTIEVVVKVLAEGRRPWRYFMDPWNIFDFSIVAVCYLAFVMPNINAGFVAVLRLARILRVFKLVTAVPQLQLLVGALLKSIPSMGYVGILLSLLFYIYAAMAVFLFGPNDPIHFADLQSSMLSLFRVVTLEDWTDIMYINMFGCDHPIWGYGDLSACSNPTGYGWTAAAFFVSFVLIGTMIVLNLFIGVIMNSMDEARAEADEEENLKRKEADEVSVEDELHAITAKLDALKTEMDFVYKRMRHVNATGNGASIRPEDDAHTGSHP